MRRVDDVAFEEPISTVSASKLGSRLTQGVSSPGVLIFYIYSLYSRCRSQPLQLSLKILWVSISNLSACLGYCFVCIMVPLNSRQIAYANAFGDASTTKNMMGRVGILIVMIPKESKGNRLFARRFQRGPPIRRIPMQSIIQNLIIHPAIKDTADTQRNTPPTLPPRTLLASDLAVIMIADAPGNTPRTVLASDLAVIVAADTLPKSLLYLQPPHQSDRAMSDAPPIINHSLKNPPNILTMPLFTVCNCTF